MRVACSLIVVMLVACNRDGGGAPDSSSTDAAMLTCLQIADGLRARTQAVSRQCTTIDDCELVGYASSDGVVATCNCAPHFAVSCEGDPVNWQAWSADVRAQELLVQWRTRCLAEGCGVSGTCGCDCGRENVVCGISGVCGATSNNECFSAL